MPPERTSAGPVLAWTDRGDRDRLAMALSMLGLRVRAFEGDEEGLSTDDLADITTHFDALVDVPLTSAALAAATIKPDIKFVVEAEVAEHTGLDAAGIPASRIAILPSYDVEEGIWSPLCALLNLPPPAEVFPVGALRCARLFRDDRERAHDVPRSGKRLQIDASPWVLPPASDWQPRPPTRCSTDFKGDLRFFASMRASVSSFSSLMETFPGNLATFAKEAVTFDKFGVQLKLEKTEEGPKQYRSGALASVATFKYGRFQAEIRAACGDGLVTGFFLHRSAPRQEIDVEFLGSDPHVMIINVYFNPGDEGMAMAYGYRGTPFRINLGFDATADFHQYSIDWRPDRIVWSVDGKVLHERVGWDPTPIPHLPMRLHTNLWGPRSIDLAGRVDGKSLPARVNVRNVSVWE